MEGVAWVKNKLVTLGYTAETGGTKAKPVGNIIVHETDFDMSKTKDGYHSDKPTITASVYRNTLAECYQVFNTLRAGLTSDIANGIRHAKIVGRDSRRYMDEGEFYGLHIEIDLSINI